LDIFRLKIKPADSETRKE